ncbi:MAG: cation-transporting P-type ATPase [Planctomycetes bacterium]|nr:cation-transporting P-type ATPase [Planctomycetota bacterium]
MAARSDQRVTAGSTAAHARPGEEIAAELGVDPQRGLTTSEARRRLRRYGRNRLREARPRSALALLVHQFRSLIVALLVAALVISMFTRDWPEAIAIGVVIVINAAIGFVSELRAVRSMEALRRMGRAMTVVRRDGRAQNLPADALVPGDLVLVEGGDVVTADIRLLAASKLLGDESALTGESAPVRKHPDPLPAATTLAERANMLFKGTAVTNGSGLGVVVSTGMTTELGQISRLVEEGLDPQRTPLERRLDQLGRSLVWVTVALTALVALAGVLSDRPPLLIVKTAIALAVAAVPEGLPIVATLALARGMWRMARQNALIRRLAAVETLGATTVICTDKTGTLTENRMVVTTLATAGGNLDVGTDRARGDDEDLGALRRDMLEVGVLCNNAQVGDSARDERRRVGDPMEIALLEAGARFGLDHASLLERTPELREVAFDSQTKMMATYHRSGDRVRVCVKGAPEAVLAAATHGGTGDDLAALDPERRAEWTRRNDALAADGMRVLALATKDVDDEAAPPFEGLTLLGLVGLVDPPRPDVRDAVIACQSAGVRIVMLTGDQAATAAFVGRRLGLLGADDERIVHADDLPADPTADVDGDGDATPRVLDASLFARVSPAQKLDLIRLYQSRGEIVAMTGDGVNDAPALKSADIGIAMGKRGTEVAREAADMVLRDDAFPTIVAAIGQGRVIFDNIRCFIRYLISCNISEILVVFLAAAANLPLPMLPLQILFLNLVTDVFPALALGFGEGDERVMDRPPRDPQEPVVTRRHWAGIAAHGVLLAVVTLAALVLALYWLKLDEQQAVTVSFLTIALAQLWHVFNVRRAGSGTISNEITRNPYVWGAIVLCCGLVAAAMYVPALASALDVVDPGPRGWLLLLTASFVPLLVGQAVLIGIRLHRARRKPA